MNRIIVVAKQDNAIRILYSDALTEEGYEVITKESTSGLMELIQMNRPDLVVVDMAPGDNEALGMCHDIRKAHDDLPVILSTVYATFKPDAKSQDAERCACSDWDIEELKGLIQRTVEGNERFPPGVIFNEGDGCVDE